MKCAQCGRPLEPDWFWNYCYTCIALGAHNAEPNIKLRHDISEEQLTLTSLLNILKGDIYKKFAKENGWIDDYEIDTLIQELEEKIASFVPKIIVTPDA